MKPAKSPVKEYDFFELYGQFIKESTNGKRLQPNGKRISKGTLENYRNCLRVFRKFSEQKQFLLRLRPVHRLNKRELVIEKNYWKKFYRRLTSYLYDDCGYYDNSAGQIIKNVRTFMGYLKKEKGIDAGEFYKFFYARKEAITIFPLMPEELNFLAYNKEFEMSLNKRMQELKDFFVFGCTVALRFSDLNALQKNKIRHINGDHYLAVRSIKTGIDTLIKLPDYAIAIVGKYGNLKKRLLPYFSMSRMNETVKLLAERAGFTQVVYITRNRRGKPVVQKRKDRKELRFCDVVSSHTMRRTAITTMLSLGVPEQIVRKISGHTPGSEEFYRYVSWSQTYLDKSTEEMFEKLKEKKLDTNPQFNAMAGIM